MVPLLPVLLVLADSARGEEPTPPVAEALAEGDRIHLAVTASGGGSLGAYQAGWLYYLSEITKANPDILDIDVVTGTSAGGINTFVLVLSACGPADPDPHQSPLYRTWVPIGIEDLYVPDSTVPDGVFDRAGFSAVLEDLRGGFDGGLRDGCAIDWGVTATRLVPRAVPLTSGYETPLAQERLVVRIEGRGDGQPPRTRARLLPDVGYAQPVLPVSDPTADAFALLRDAAFATSAFPVAFRPMILPTCLLAATDDPTACALASTERHRYVDGGLYDNAPIRLAHRIVAANGGDATVYLYLDAYLGRFPNPPAPDETAAPSRTVGLLADIAGSVLWVSGQRSLVTLLEEDATIGDRLSVATAYSPQFSRELSGFFGLFQQELREYDFWLGVYSAWRELHDRSVLFRMTELKLPQDDPAAPAEAWAVFRCLAATYEGADPTGCESAEAQRLAPLIQVGAERLYAWCAATPAGTNSGLGSEHCEAARAGEPPPRVPGVDEAGPDWALRPGENPLNHALRRLAWYGFVFTDLGEVKPSAEGSRRAVRRALLKMAHRLAATNGGQEIVMRLVGNTMVDKMIPPLTKAPSENGARGTNHGPQ